MYLIKSYYNNKYIYLRYLLRNLSIFNNVIKLRKLII